MPARTTRKLKILRYRLVSASTSSGGRSRAAQISPTRTPSDASLSARERAKASVSRTRAESKATLGEGEKRSRGQLELSCTYSGDRARAPSGRRDRSLGQTKLTKRICSSLPGKGWGWGSSRSCCRACVDGGKVNSVCPLACGMLRPTPDALSSLGQPRACILTVSSDGESRSSSRSVASRMSSCTSDSLSSLSSGKSSAFSSTMARAMKAPRVSLTWSGGAGAVWMGGTGTRAGHATRIGSPFHCTAELASELRQVWHARPHWHGDKDNRAACRSPARRGSGT
eukprot:scaffold6432_cov107-Isochrysis_galbana.AAC.4